jgi:hypothetical protein
MTLSEAENLITNNLSINSCSSFIISCGIYYINFIDTIPGFLFTIYKKNSNELKYARLVDKWDNFLFKDYEINKDILSITEAAQLIIYLNRMSKVDLFK